MHDVAPLVVTAGLMGMEYAKARGIDAAVDSLLGRVVGNVADKRAQRFMLKLVEAIVPDATERDDAEVRTILDRVTSSEAAAERVFDGYRRSLLSKSRTIGPRVQALLVARLLAEDREASKEEQAIADVAEQCTDSDLTSLLAFWTSITAFGPSKSVKIINSTKESIAVQAAYETAKGYLDASTHQYGGPLNLAMWYGRWASVLEAAGLVTQSEERKNNVIRADLEFVDEDFVRRELISIVYFDRACDDLANLVLLCIDSGFKRAAH